jgi:hypothetical protein
MVKQIKLAALLPAYAPQVNTSLLQSSRKTDDLVFLRDSYIKLQKTANIEQIQDAIVQIRKLGKTTDSTVSKFITAAQQDIDIAKSLTKQEEQTQCTAYIKYALFKLGHIINIFTHRANLHIAQGYDISGEVFEPGEQESRSPNLWDQANSPKDNQTSINPINTGIDSEAEAEFPELQKIKHKRIEWPARLR